MKFKLLIYAIALSAVVLPGFTSCDDDDTEIILGPNEQPEYPSIKPGEESMRVKVGAENRQELTVTDGAGDFNAFSLNKSVATVVKDGDKLYVEGLGNGMTEVIVTDKSSQSISIPVAVYTTDVMSLEEASKALNVNFGSSETFTGKVALGNGGYTIASISDELRVSAEIIDSETGEFEVTAKAGKDKYIATITIEDRTGLTVDYTVEVSTTFELPFTDEQISTAISNARRWNESDCNLNGRQVSYLCGYGYGDMIDETNDANAVLGWNYINRYDFRITYPADAVLNQEYDGHLFYSYYGTVDVDRDGKVMLACDDEDVKLVLFWDFDLDAERIHSGYVVYYKG
ncbi:hypothetical protein [Duncaniella freteri]|uniref:hypothetical protein n=3 Tax=Duncaniella TaxID=2518495 RepID=UPI00136F3379|nr:hypothetical protein [Duncaniella freteri]NBJ07764.1 hypothetical protein [Alistipes sp. Z76]NCE69807.1 hypothetical protein [Muribaculaceae bacterium M3]